MKKFIIVSLMSFVMLFVLTVNAQAVVIVPQPSSAPTTATECKKNGWQNYGGMFKNQGDCVSFVVTNGRNEPSGPLN